MLLLRRMRKQLLCILLSTFVLYTVTKDVWTYAFFKANQTFIAQALCIDKDDSQSSCKGKCYLKKKLSENRGDEKAPILEMSSQKVYFIPSIKSFHLNSPNSVVESIFSIDTPLGRSYLDNLFRPPPKFI